MKKIVKIILLGITLYTCADDNFIYHNHEETLALIQKIIGDKEKGIYLRIGDGDTNLAAGLSSGTHMVSKALQQEAQQVLKMEGKNIIKTLPLDPHVYQKDNTTYDAYFTLKHAQDVMRRARAWWGKDRNVYSAQFLSHYAVVDIPKCVEFLRFLKNSNCSLLVGSQRISEKVRTLLFGPECHFIATPEKNAYQALSRIERETLKAIELFDPNEYHVIVLSLGNTGRVLARRIYQKITKNVFFFDFGSLMDAICGLQTCLWIRSHFEYDIFFPQLEKVLSVN